MQKLSFQFHNLDFFTILSSKGANFFVTSAIFYIAREENINFAQFGLNWSIALFLGGIIIGTLSPAIIRLLFTMGGKSWIAKYTFDLNNFLKGILLFLFLIIFFGTFEWFKLFWLGFFINTSIVIISILRAISAYKIVLISSAVYIFTTIGSLFIFKVLIDLDYLSALVCSYLISTLIISAISLVPIKAFICSADIGRFNLNNFIETYLSYFFLNVFSFGVMTLDFVMLERVLNKTQFDIFGGAKIYLDRFLIPFLSVIVGTITINFLRHESSSSTGNAYIALSKLGLKEVIAFITFLSLGLVGYYIFNIIFQLVEIPQETIFLLIIGYMLFSLNAIYLDVIIIKYSLYFITMMFVGFFVFYLSLIYSFIILFGPQGWAIAFLLANLLILIALVYLTSSISKR